MTHAVSLICPTNLGRTWFLCVLKKECIEFCYEKFDTELILAKLLDILWNYRWQSSLLNSCNTNSGYVLETECSRVAQKIAMAW